jgi:hypothetical protein
VKVVEQECYSVGRLNSFEVKLSHAWALGVPLIACRIFKADALCFELIGEEDLLLTAIH